MLNNQVMITQCRIQIECTGEILNNCCVVLYLLVQVVNRGDPYPAEVTEQLLCGFVFVGTGCE